MKRNPIRVLALRETRGLVQSPGGWIILGTFWFVAGLVMVSLLFRYRELSFQAAQSSASRGGPMGLHVNDWVVRPLLYNLGTVLILFVPLLTMRSFAEERRTGNLELLLSQPLRGWELVLGKLCGALAALVLSLAVLAPHLALVAWVSRPDWPATLTGVFGLFLLGLLFTMVGVLVSIVSRSQIEAAVLGLGALLLLVIGPGAISSGPSWLRETIEFLGALSRFEDFTRGVFDLGHVAYFLGASLLLLAAALRSVDVIRWQG